MGDLCIRPIEKDRWDEVIRRFPFNLYNTYSWTDTICRSFGGEAIFLSFLRDGEIVGCANLIIMKYAFLRVGFAPFPRIWGKPTLLVADDERNNIGQFMDLLCRQLRRMNVGMLHIYLPIPQDSFRLIKRLETEIVALDKCSEEYWARSLSRGKRRDVHYAQKFGIHVKAARNIRDLTLFYKMYSEVWNHMDVFRWARKKHPISYFGSLLQNPRNRLWLAYRDDCVMAGSMITSGNETACYQHNASFRRYRKYFPNHLLMWHAIRSAAAEGYKYFDLGGVNRTSVSGTFKTGWGETTQETYHYYSIPLNAGGRVINGILRCASVVRGSSARP